jgi:NodT family efflux transporter outer membrane factor (OMF) lipoprotein
MNISILRRVFFTLGIPLCLAACAVGPDYARPLTAQSDAYKELAPGDMDEADWRPANPKDTDNSAWWQCFSDPVLDGLMEEAGKANQNIMAAIAALRHAEAQVREARSYLLPRLVGNMGMSRGKSGASRAVDNTYSARLQAGWEFDLFGGSRRGLESNAAQAESTAASLASVILSIRAELALNYFQLRTYDETIYLYERTVKTYSESLFITENRYREGIATQADVAQARSQLKSAQAQAVNAQINRKKTEHALAVLIGRAPSEFSLKPSKNMAKLPRIGANLPSALLERRPDVVAAEKQVEAANASIGVAKSAHFPIFDITYSDGYVSNIYSKWFTTPYHIWAFGPSLALSLFQGGVVVARTDKAIAAWERSVSNYRQTVLQALRDVEDALVSAHMLIEEQAFQQEALDASREAEQILMNQYTAGTASYQNVLIAQTNTLNNARTIVQLQGARFAAAVSLIRALGGGWDITDLKNTQ